MTPEQIDNLIKETKEKFDSLESERIMCVKRASEIATQLLQLQGRYAQLQELKELVSNEETNLTP